MLRVQTHKLLTFKPKHFGAVLGLDSNGWVLFFPEELKEWFERFQIETADELLAHLESTPEDFCCLGSGISSRFGFADDVRKQAKAMRRKYREHLTPRARKARRAFGALNPSDKPKAE